MAGRAHVWTAVLEQEGPGLSVLVVCVGNACRSPLMARLLAQRMPTASVTSAGTGAVAGRPMEQLAAAELLRLGGSPDGSTARRLAPSQIMAADLILTATVDVRSAVLDEVAGALHRTFTWLEFAALTALAPPLDGRAIIRWAADHRPLVSQRSIDLPDPMGAGAKVHGAVADMIAGTVTQIADALDDRAATRGRHGDGTA